MKRVTLRWAICVAMCLAASLLATGGARASDIVCHPRASSAPVVCEDPGGNGMRCALNTESARANGARNRLLCDSAGLSERYERIYAEQQRMLHKGTIQNADITAWRARRDACDSARCLESLFHLFWRDRGSMHMAAAPAPRAAASAPPPVRHDAAPAPATPAQHVVAEASPATPPVAPVSTPPTRTSFETPVASPVASPVAAPVARARVSTSEAVDISLSDSDTPASGDGPGPASLAWESTLSALAIVAAGAGVLWYRRRASPPYQSPMVIPAVMLIAYALLLVNVLLLPFTLSLK